MLFGRLLTNTAQMFADVRTCWSPEAIERISGWKPDGILKDGAIHLINSGSCTLDGTGQQSDEKGNPIMKPYWKIKQTEVDRMLEATTWYPANREYMRGGGYSSKFLTKAGMSVTMCRLNLIKGLGPTLQLAEGWTARFPDEVFNAIDKRTDKTWPSTFFVPRITGKGRFKDVYSVMNYWGANHGAISYGHIGADLITLASALRIPVSMHNVEDEKIFRPAVWPAFGSDNEGADYRACRAYGAVYK
jgi:L-fucose isomerase